MKYTDVRSGTALLKRIGALLSGTEKIMSLSSKMSFQAIYFFQRLIKGLLVVVPP